MFSVQTLSTSKDEYLTRPDLGARFDDETLAEIKKRCLPNPQVQVYVSDGLSSTAVEAAAHIADFIQQMLEQQTSGINLKL